MRLVVTTAAVVALSVLALGQDKPASPPSAPVLPDPKVVSVVEWKKLYAEIIAGAKTTMERVDRLRLLVKSVVVDCRGKIRDIAPAPANDPPKAIIHVCPVGGGHDVRTFTLFKADIEGWKQWDRLAWRMRAEINDDGELVWFDAVDPPAPFHSANPGIEPAELDKPTATAKQFQEWLEKFAYAAYYERRSDAESLWKTACERSWVFPATITAAPDAQSQTLIQLERESYIYAVQDTDRVRPKTYFSTTFRQDYGERAIRWWGIRADRYMYVYDEELRPFIRSGDKAEVYFEFAAADLERAKQGELPVYGRVWKVPKAAARAK